MSAGKVMTRCFRSPHICEAYVENYSACFRSNSLVEASDRKVIVLATSLEIEPANGARVTVRRLM